MGSLALIGDEPPELRASGLGGRALGEGRITCGFGAAKTLLFRRHLCAKARDAPLEPEKIAAPRVHLTRGVRDFQREPTSHQLAMTLGAFSLARQRADLALDFRDEVVDAGQVGCRFLQTSLSAPLAVAIETHARRFLEQLASVVGSIGKQCVNHPRFDYHTGIGAESGAPNHVVDVTQAAGSAIEEIIAFAGATQSSRYHHFAERNVERTIVILEMQRDFSDVHGAPRGRSLEDHLFHLRAAQGPGALLAEYPAHGIGDVGFSAAVGAHYRGDTGLEHHFDAVSERLEPVNLELR